MDDDRPLRNFSNTTLSNEIGNGFSTKAECSSAEELFLAEKGVGIWRRGNL